MFPATLFDYNGVLVDDEAVHLEAFREVLAPSGIQVSEQAYWDRYIGFDDAGAFRAILEDAGKKPRNDEIERLIAAKKPVYLEQARRGLRTFEGARELVARRAAVGPVVIVSGALHDEIELGVDHLGVRSDILAIVSAEDTTESKPSPEGYLIGLALLEKKVGASAHRALVVEDSVAGVEAAKAAHLTCVAVPHSYRAERLSAAGADWVAPNLSGITEGALRDLYRRAYG